MQRIRGKVRTNGIVCLSHDNVLPEAIEWMKARKGTFLTIIDGPVAPGTCPEYHCDGVLYEVAQEDCWIPNSVNHAFVCEHEIEIGD